MNYQQQPELSPGEEMGIWASAFEGLIRDGLAQDYDVEFLQTAIDLAWYRLAIEAAANSSDEDESSQLS